LRVHSTGMSWTPPEPSVRRKRLACQWAKFGIDVQSQILPTRFRNRARSAPPVPPGWSCRPCPRLSLASAWTYATALGASLRNVRSVLSSSEGQLSLLSARVLFKLSRSRGAILGTFRFLLALSVALSHFGTVWGYHIMNGRMAVQCFYMISGFLISLVLSHKYDPSTAEGRRLFYSNRALRI